MAGHSKWANIQHRKGAQDKKRGALFTRLVREITVAARMGGPDPNMNPRLRLAVDKATAQSMPKDNIERAIKKATDKDAADLKQVTFEGYGPHGIAVFVETATDNNNRTVANVRSYFNKCNGSLGTTGSVEFMFTHVCHFKIAAEGRDAEELELELIDYGAEEIGVDEESIMIYGPFESYGGIQKKLEEDGIEIQESGFDRIPTTTKELGTEETEEVEKLIEKLEEDEDVQNVFHTMSSSTED